MPIPGTFFHPTDTGSTTLAEAEDHARCHAGDDDDEPDFSYPGEDFDEDDFDLCNCSDPCCPCTGVKVGVP